MSLATENTLICDANDIFDASTVRDAIAGNIEAAPDYAAKRAIVVDALRAANVAGRAAIADAFKLQPFAARALTRSYTYLTDGLVTTALWVARACLHPISTPTNGERIALIAVGGYGRGEMAPYSDVDLLFLTPYKITPWAESVIETMLYVLWDLKLKVGHSSRTIRDCIRLGSADYTIQTALLEHRFLDGDAGLAADLDAALKNDLFSGSGRDFIEAKLDERDKRHLRQGQRYVVEPNVKEGKGGLRDLQSLYWIAKYIQGVNDAAELVELGVFRPEEYQLFVDAEDFLWAVRAHLHLVTGRPTEQLAFDLQVEVAARMGYADKAGRRAVEIFMQDYFRHATSVGDLTRIFLTKLEAIHVKPEPLLQRIFRRTPKVNDGYEVIHNRLSIAEPDVFLTDKLNILRLFEEALRTGMLIHPDAMRQ
ncbi:MAG: nucleotidyltransferase domain-containing protein, partial [Pseudomonadota bacterium]